jgi:hypothetical protein
MCGKIFAKAKSEHFSAHNAIFENNASALHYKIYLKHTYKKEISDVSSTQVTQPQSNVYFFGVLVYVLATPRPFCIFGEMSGFEPRELP